MLSFKSEYFGRHDHQMVYLGDRKRTPRRVNKGIEYQPVVAAQACEMPMQIA
jgi:hypothetical protein